MTGDPTGKEDASDGGTSPSTMEMRPSDLALTPLDNPIDYAQHHIESIETHIGKQGTSAISIELVRLLWELQDVYQRRITDLTADNRTMPEEFQSCPS
jgi:hypothetical protein